MVLRISEVQKFWDFLNGSPRSILSLIVLILLNLACQATANFSSPSTSTPLSPTKINTPLPPLPSATLFPTATIPGAPSPPPTSTPAQLTTFSGCENIIAFRLLGLPEQTKDLFEHHAKGTFLILHLEAINLTRNPIQIFSQDYALILHRENNELTLAPHQAATNYLYLVRGDNFYQDKIKPASIWRTYLAFDIPRDTIEWKLLIAPGAANSPPICQTTLEP